MEGGGYEGTITSSAVIEVLIELFARHGLPRVVISDNGTMFTLAEFRAFVASFGIKHNLTALYNPQSNGATERFNKVLKEGLTVALCEGAPFSVTIRNILINYRSLPHATTGVSPAKLFYGRDIRMPLNAWKDQHYSVLIQSTEREKVAKHVSFKQELTKVYTDKKRHAKPTQVIIGDYVRTKRPVKHEKLEPTWSTKKV